MPKLTDQEMMDFLAERSHLARIATVRADGSPSVVPVWFIFEGGKVLITPRKHSAFLQNLRREPRVAITIDEEAGRYRKVLFEGKAEILFEPGDDRKWDDVYRRIACRYVDEASADYYLTETKDQPRALIGVDRANANRERTVLGDLGSAILRRGYQDGADGFPRDRCKTQGNLTVAVRRTPRASSSRATFSARQCRCCRGPARPGRILKRALRNLIDHAVGFAARAPLHFMDASSLKE